VDKGNGQSYQKPEINAHGEEGKIEVWWATEGDDEANKEEFVTTCSPADVKYYSLNRRRCFCSC
jgi:hypothetical protein